MDVINDLLLHCEHVGVKVIFLTYCIIINNLMFIDNVSASGCGFNGGTLFGHGLKIQFRISRLM